MLKTVKIYMLSCLIVCSSLAFTHVKNSAFAVSNQLVAHGLDVVALWEAALVDLKKDLFQPAGTVRRPVHFMKHQAELPFANLALCSVRASLKKGYELPLEFAYDRVKIPRVNAMNIKVDDDVSHATRELTLEYKQYQQDELPAFSFAYLSSKPKDLVYDKIRAEAIRRP
jgi:hypothetical protein